MLAFCQFDAISDGPNAIVRARDFAERPINPCHAKTSCRFNDALLVFWYQDCLNPDKGPAVVVPASKI
jgi:hypothetical protein